MNVGKLVRMNRLFSHPSGRLCSVAVDHLYPRDPSTGQIFFTPEEIAWAARCAVEVGSDVVKVPYCGDDRAEHLGIRADCRRSRGVQERHPRQ